MKALRSPIAVTIMSEKRHFTLLKELVKRGEECHDGYWEEKVVNELLVDDQLSQLKEIIRTARGLVRTASMDVGKNEVVRGWWEALVNALEYVDD